MSEYFTGVTFPEQKVTPSDDAIFHRAVLPDGILTGCAFSYSGSTLTMGAGYLLICGRIVRHTAVQNWSIVDASSGYARLVLTIDLTRTSTVDEFDQVVDAIEYASSVDGFTELETADINRNGTKYQVVVCVVSLGGGGISAIVSQLEKSSGNIAQRRVTGAAIHEGTDKATVTLTLEGGAEERYEVLWDENGYPAKITRGDGSVCSFVWTADAPVEEDFDGVLFDGGSAVTWLDGSGAQVSGASLSGSASVVSAYGDYFYTAEPVDLTDFDTLKVRFTAANDNNTFAVSKTVSTLAADFAASQIVTAAGEAELDISALTGQYYVLVLSGTPMTGSTSTFTADKVWLE